MFLDQYSVCRGLYTGIRDNYRTHRGTHTMFLEQYSVCRGMYTRVRDNY